jgi:cell division protein FtsQ
VPSQRGEERARVRDVAASLPKTRVDIARWLPSGASLAIGFLLLGIAAASYGLARETSLFAIERVEVVGGSPEVRQHVREALAPLEGRSLVGLRATDVESPLAAVPDVAGATYDRAFPQTLRVFVLAERPLLVLRRGEESWLVSVRGRVLRRLAPGTRARLPRLWVRRTVDAAAGSTLVDPTALRGVRLLAAAAAAEIPTGVRTVRFDGDDAFVILRDGVEVRLGNELDLRLKLAVAATVLPRLAEDETYLDVAVPARPVAGEHSSSGRD